MKEKKPHLKNKFAIVIGGKGLIGRQIVKDFTEQGAKVLILDLIKKNKMKTKNKKIFFQNFDLSETSKINKNLKKIVLQYGCPDIFVNAAYPRTKMWHKCTYEDLTYEELDKNVNIQFNSFIWSAMKIAELMKKHKKRGSIIILNSIYGKVSQNKSLYKGTNINFNPVYSAVKGGLITFVKNLSSYYGEFGIRANSIICGGVMGHSSATNKKMNKFFIKKYLSNTLLKRMASSKDISASVLFLSSDLSSYITGSELTVDGGYTVI